MSRASHVRLMAEYNSWMNDKLYAAAASLPETALAEDRGAFFGSILGTLNHLAVGDTIWLKRFADHPHDPAGAGHPALQPLRDVPLPSGLDVQLCANLAELAERRRWLDGIIGTWATALTEAELGPECLLHYANTKGVVHNKEFFSVLMHFFNHQTHHRGQASTLLSQAGADIGVTDLLALIPTIAM
jgi:uncharacterized damage-inducible protein DinB